MKKAKIGIVGLGFMGTTHWGVYKGLKNAQIVAIADVDAKKRKGDISAVVGNIGGGDNSKPLDLTGVKVYDCALALAKDPDVDVVDICVPTPDHAEIVCAALAAGKHVFCEKPLCRDAAKMKKIVAAVKAERRNLEIKNFYHSLRATTVRENVFLQVEEFLKTAGSKKETCLR